MKDDKNDNIEITDDDIIAAYNSPKESAEESAPEAAAESETGEGSDAPKKKKRGIERHLYPCPHCGEKVLDHFTECPKCGGELKPRGYHVDEQKRGKVVRAFEIAGAVVSVGLVILLTILLNR
ncbi:MAG: hypothetical protein J1G38_06535 [Clostridiales bacterium]|nr:hypothetical protein [Clostridiales bacterium]